MDLTGSYDDEAINSVTVPLQDMRVLLVHTAGFLPDWDTSFTTMTEARQIAATFQAIRLGFMSHSLKDGNHMTGAGTAYAAEIASSLSNIEFHKTAVSVAYDNLGMFETHNQLGFIYRAAACLAVVSGDIKKAQQLLEKATGVEQKPDSEKAKMN